MQTDIEQIESSLNEQLLKDFPELLMCIQYIILRDMNEPKLSMDEVVGQLHEMFPDIPSSRQGLYLRVEKWRKNGTLEQARGIVLAPKLEEYRVVVQEIIYEMPNLIRKMIDDVKTGKAKSRSLDIVIWLDQYAQRGMQEAVAGGAHEKKYLEATANFNPTDIPDDDFDIVAVP